MKVIKATILSTLLFIMVALPVMGQGEDVDSRYEGTVDAPPFPSGVTWINVDAPLSLDELEGKIVILDFWTYGCINCIHMIPVLEQLEQEFASEIVVIGVHSAKFETEANSENIRQIVQRYTRAHPVVNDSGFTIWRSYGVQAWPTFVIIDPMGRVVARQAGEVPYEAFAMYIGAMIDYYDAKDPEIIDRTPLELALEGAKAPNTPLRFPGKVLVDEAGERLFIADSNHHRIVIADLTTYEVLDIIGSGQRGFTDGAYSNATFNLPQGMTIDGDTLYIADTYNHAIRAVDLAEKQVSTIAGTGQQGTGIPRANVSIDDPLNYDLRSPWDVEVTADQLIIAMAGTHQIWAMDLTGNTLRVLVGNGREAQYNDTLLTSELAQPSGLHLTGDLLYFADSESSTIRVADLAANRVFVASGTTDNNLFDFGDEDGEPGVSRLQHALGVTASPDGSTVYIADTYNNKIKIYHPETGITETLTGQGGSGGYRDGTLEEAAFDEPGGIDYADNRLYVADTNNHVIRVIDLNTNTVDTIQFPDPAALIVPDSGVTVVGGNRAEGVELTLATQSVAAGEGEIVLTLNIPDGYKINDLTESLLDVVSTSDAVLLNGDQPKVSTVIESEAVRIPVTLNEGDGNLNANITLFYCEANNETFCLVDQVMIRVPVTVNDDNGESTIRIERDVTLPDIIGGF